MPLISWGMIFIFPSRFFYQKCLCTLKVVLTSVVWANNFHLKSQQLDTISSQRCDLFHTCPLFVQQILLHPDPRKQSGHLPDFRHWHHHSFEARGDFKIPQEKFKCLSLYQEVCHSFILMITDLTYLTYHAAGNKRVQVAVHVPLLLGA